MIATERHERLFQGGVLSPLLCELQTFPIHIQAYTDDVSVLAVGRDLGTLCGNIQCALGLIATVLFTEKRKLFLAFRYDTCNPSILRRGEIFGSDSRKKTCLEKLIMHP